MTEATAKKQIFYIYDILNLKKNTRTQEKKHMRRWRRFAKFAQSYRV